MFRNCRLNQFQVNFLTSVVEIENFNGATFEFIKVESLNGANVEADGIFR